MVRLGADSLLVQRRLQCCNLGVRCVHPSDWAELQGRNWHRCNGLLDRLDGDQFEWCYRRAVSCALSCAG